MNIDPASVIIKSEFISVIHFNNQPKISETGLENSIGPTYGWLKIIASEDPVFTVSGELTEGMSFF